MNGTQSHLLPPPSLIFILARVQMLAKHILVNMPAPRRAKVRVWCAQAMMMCVCVFVATNEFKFHSWLVARLAWTFAYWFRVWRACLCHFTFYAGSAMCAWRMRKTPRYESEWTTSPTFTDYEVSLRARRIRMWVPVWVSLCVLCARTPRDGEEGGFGIDRLHNGFRGRELYLECTYI